MQYIQEFSIKQGVGVSQTRVNLGFVWEFCRDGGRSVTGFRGFPDRKNRILRGDAERLRRIGNGIFHALNLNENLIPDAVHLVSMDQPALVNEQILKFPG